MIYCLSSVFAWERLGNAHTSGEAAHLGGRSLWQYRWVVAGSRRCSLFGRDSRRDVWPSLEQEWTPVQPLCTSALLAAFLRLAWIVNCAGNRLSLSYGLEDQNEWQKINLVSVLLGLTVKHSAKPSRAFFSSLANMILLEFLTLTPITIMRLQQWARLLAFLRLGYSYLTPTLPMISSLPWLSQTGPSSIYTVFP